MTRTPKVMPRTPKVKPRNPKVPPRTTKSRRGLQKSARGLQHTEGNDPGKDRLTNIFGPKCRDRHRNGDFLKYTFQTQQDDFLLPVVHWFSKCTIHETCKIHYFPLMAGVLIFYMLDDDVASVFLSPII